MTRQIDLAGASGTRYRYSPLDENRFLPPAGANYVIAELTNTGANVVYAGETDNLASQTWRVDLENARRKSSSALAAASFPWNCAVMVRASSALTSRGLAAPDSTLCRREAISAAGKSVNSSK